MAKNLSNLPTPTVLFPVDNSTEPFWRKQPHKLDNYRSPLDTLPECDILIVGAGYTGITTAYHILDGNSNPPSIMIVDARQACSGATGRNAGHLRPVSAQILKELSDRYGTEAASEVANFELSHIQAVKDLVEKENIDCDFTLTRTMDVFLDASHANIEKASYDELARTGHPIMSDLQFTSGPRAEGITGVKGAKACCSFTAAHLWPYKLMMHLLSLAVSKGVNLQTHTPVSDISPTSDSSGRWVVTTSRGTIRAKTVVLASNGYTAGIAPQYSNMIRPIRLIGCNITIPKECRASLLTNTYVIWQRAGERDYFMPRADGSIIAGGAMHTYLNHPEQWCTSDDADVPVATKTYFDGYMQKTFRGWEDSEAYAENIWCGIGGLSTDLLPHIGAVPGRPGQFIAAGFSGHGMPVIFLATKGLAKMICEGTPFEETGVPKLYKTTEERLT